MSAPKALRAKGAGESRSSQARGLATNPSIASACRMAANFAAERLVTQPVAAELAALAWVFAEVAGRLMQ